MIDLPSKRIGLNRGLVTMFICLANLAPHLYGQQAKETQTPRSSVLPFVSGEPRYSILNINNLTTWARSDGHSNHSPNSDNGLYFPRGTVNVIYQDGLVWGAKAYLDPSHTQPAPRQLVRVGGGTYSVGTRAGWVSGLGASAVPVDPADAAVRVYRIRRDYTQLRYDWGGYTAELQNDAASFFEVPSYQASDAQMEFVYQQYHKDWTEWPVSLGAPYVERNGIPGYQPPPPFSPLFSVDSLILGGYDEPGVAGRDPVNVADQVLWMVYNDLNVGQTTNFSGSEPLGLEIQKTVWGYKSSAAEGNMYFSRYRLLNKGGVDTDSTAGHQSGSFFLDSVYVLQWVDPDLGFFSDDLVGCDTLLQLGFCYNANETDVAFSNYGLPPASIGYTLLQGALVPSPGDSGVFGFSYRTGFANRVMTAFGAWGSGDPYAEPALCFSTPDAYNCITGQWWKVLRGYAPLGTMSSADEYYAHPAGVNPFYRFSGDPVTRIPWLDGEGTSTSFLPGDRRMHVNTGPFTLAPGDTQEVILAIVAGLGADRLSSVSVMKGHAKAAHANQKRLFAVPRPPLQPAATAKGFDSEILIEWGSDHQRVHGTEETVVIGEYYFEGYNVYQIPDASASRENWVKIATYDIDNGIRNILDEQVNVETGILTPTLAQSGTDSGIRRFFRATRDFTGDSPGLTKLSNGKEYFYAVTAYNYSPNNSFPQTLESEPIVLSAKPQIPFGLQPTSAFGDTIPMAHLSGLSTATITATILDPTLGTGNLYELRIDTANGSTFWNVINMNTNELVATNQPVLANQTHTSIVTGGVLISVEAPFRGLRKDTWSWVPSSGRFLSFAGGQFGLEEFQGAVGHASPRSLFGDGVMLVGPGELKDIEIRFAPTSDNQGTFDELDPNVSFAYRYGREFQQPAAQPSFGPWIANPTGGYAYQDYRRSIPLAVYDIEAVPPRRLSVGFLESNVSAGSVNGFYWPPLLTGDNIQLSGPREWLFIFDHDYAGTPDPRYTGDLLTDSMRVMYMATWTRRNDNPWPAGNSMFLYANRVLTPTDVYSYSVPAPLTGLSEAKASAQRVGVFPNPYYAFRQQETTSWRQFVTFNNLPPKATIRIFNLAGQLVRILEKDNPSQFLEWDLTNKDRWQVASGMYICHVEMPEIGEIKVLKLAVIQPQIIR